MAAMSQYLRDALIKHSLLHTAYTSPTAVYLALFITPPTSTGGGTEVTGGSYVRLSIMSNLAFGATGSGTVTNSAPLTITGMPACTVVGGAIYDASTSGNLLFFGQLTTARTVTGGAAFTLTTGDLEAVIG